jgi:hypothetical protein
MFQAKYGNTKKLWANYALLFVFLGLSGVVAGLIIPEVVISSKAELEYKVRELEVSVRSLQVQQTGD